MGIGLGLAPGRHPAAHPPPRWHPLVVGPLHLYTAADTVTQTDPTTPQAALTAAFILVPFNRDPRAATSGSASSSDNLKQPQVGLRVDGSQTGMPEV